MSFLKNWVAKKGIDAFDNHLKDRQDKVASTAGGAAAVATAPAAVLTTSALTGLTGGAAIMKTLAVAGAIVGGGAVAGILVVGTGALAVGWGVKEIVKKRQKAGK